MAPAPMLRLSLERKIGPDSQNGDATKIARESYVLRLESANGGAVVVEQQSRVRPEAMTGALRELETLLAEDGLGSRSLERLRSVGGLLGEASCSASRARSKTSEALRSKTRAAGPPTSSCSCRASSCAIRGS